MAPPPDGKTDRVPEPPPPPGRRRPPRRRALLLCAALLLLLPSCMARKAYEKASEQDTVQSYEAFLKKYGDKKKYADRAEKRLEELSYEEARAADTYQAYEAFLGKYPTGRYSPDAERRGEDLRAEELGIHLYRRLPGDYYEKVTTRYLPYRILVRAQALQGASSAELAARWYANLERRDLFVPMNPEESYPVSPDITLDVRQAVVYLCGRPRAYAEAETRARGIRIKTYRVAANQVEEALLYEIFADRQLYDAVLAVPEEEKRKVAERFDQFRQRLPRRGSVAFEVDVAQDTWSWDREVAVGFSEFLAGLQPYETFAAYLRGQPPDRTFERRIFFRMDPQIHSPYLRTEWSTTGPTLKWEAYNAKWIVSEREYFFRKMTLDIADFLAGHAPHPGRKPVGGVIYMR